jgi:NAD(P)-dependent dehydrogenase (short-subunit alcohol dehydrogenase family)
MQIDLGGKRALVTGGSSGIGAAIAQALGAAGAKVAINYLNHPETADEVAQAVYKQTGQKQKDTVMTVQADVSDPQAVEKMFGQIDAAWQGIDILINNAGIDGTSALGWEGDIADWQKVIGVNLFGPYYCARQALRRMAAQKSGVVLNISSVHERIAWTGYSAYTASKAALSMMTKTLAQEAAPLGIRVLAVAPGAIKTPINRAVWSQAAGLQDLLEKIPLKRIGEPQEIANMVVVLVSDVASYVTGCTVFVDGGMTDYPDFAHGG